MKVTDAEFAGMSVCITLNGASSDPITRRNILETLNAYSHRSVKKCNFNGHQTSMQALSARKSLSDDARNISRDRAIGPFR